MEDRKLVLCDTNIFIEIYKGNEAVVSQIEKMKSNNIAVSSITVSELIFGARDKKEMSTILRSLERLNLLQVNERISQRHLALMTEFSLSHNLSIPDVLIAATAIELSLPLYTLNLKDFRYIPSLVLYP